MRPPGPVRRPAGVRRRWLRGALQRRGAVGGSLARGVGGFGSLLGGQERELGGGKIGDGQGR